MLQAPIPFKKSKYIRGYETPIVFLDDRIYANLTIDQILTKLFHPNNHFAPKAPNISQKYYEASLDQSKSAIIAHQDWDREHAFSTLPILHIHSPTKWVDNFFSPKYVVSPTGSSWPYNY